jgi:hypothetical protein
VEYVRSIPVTGENGDELVVHEFHTRTFLKKVRRMKLCTGEAVQAEDDSFVVVGTGERLKRARA